MSNMHNIRKTINYTLLGLAAAAIIVTTACGSDQKGCQPGETLAPQAYVVTGQPLGVASNCYGRIFPYCVLSVAVQDSDGSIKNLSTQKDLWESNEVASLDSAIQAEMNDKDEENIELILDEDLRIRQAVVNGVTYQH